MGLFIIIVISVGVLYLIVKTLNRTTNRNESTISKNIPDISLESKYKKTSPEEMQAARERKIKNHPTKIEQLEQTPSNAEGYFYYEMVGMYYHDVKPSDFGIYKGYAVAETNNPHDKYAVGVYRKGDDKLVGYAPKEFQGKSNKELHEEITEKGGIVDAVFKITGNIQRAYGSMYLKLAPEHIDHNKTECYKSPNLKRYIFQLNENHAGEIGKFYGRAITGERDGDMFPISIINENQVKIGCISDEYHLFNTIVKYDKGNVPAWGYICAEISDAEIRYRAYVFIPAKCSNKKISEEIESFKKERIKFKYKY